MRSFAERPRAARQASSSKTTSTDQAGLLRTDAMIPALRTTRLSADAALPPRRFHFGQIHLHPPARVMTNEKFPVSRPGDESEQEANRIAGQVMRMTEPQNLLTNQIKPADGGLTAPPTVKEVLGTSGRPLDAATRAFMEPRFGYDFGTVRLHDDSRAAESARSVQASAYTVGEHIVFGAGQHRPDTFAGRALFAHELAHVRQQSISGPVLQCAPIPGPNFTPSDFSNLKKAGNDISIAQDSSWFPSKLQENLLNTLRFLLGPKLTPRGTEGVNVLDTFHGHLVIDRKDLLMDWNGKERPPEQVTKDAAAFERQEKNAAAKTLGGNVTETKFGPNLSFPGGKYPLTDKKLPAYTAAIEKLLPAFGNVLEEAQKVPGAAVMYHTFEFISPSDLTSQGKEIANEDPRRHYVTPLDTNMPRRYTPPASPDRYEKDYLVILPFSFLMDANGAVHVRPFSGNSVFTSLELSTVTQTTLPNEPFVESMKKRP